MGGTEVVRGNLADVVRAVKDQLEIVVGEERRVVFVPCQLILLMVCVVVEEGWAGEFELSEPQVHYIASVLESMPLIRAVVLPPVQLYAVVQPVLQIPLHLFASDSVALEAEGDDVEGEGDFHALDEAFQPSIQAEYWLAMIDLRGRILPEALAMVVMPFAAEKTIELVHLRH